MIKVEHTKQHILSRETNKTNYGFDQKVESVSVTEGKLVLIPCVVGINGLGVVVDGKHYHSIIISETEKIEVGDDYYDIITKKIAKCEEQDISDYFNDLSIKRTRFKILALPEHFSHEHLQMIVDGKLKDGDKVFVECEWIKQHGMWKKEVYGSKIKLDSSNYITLYLKKKKTVYTEEDLMKAYEAGEDRIEKIKNNSIDYLGFDEFLETLHEVEEKIGNDGFMFDVNSTYPKVEEKMYTREAIQLMVADFVEKCFDENYIYSSRSALKNKIKEWFDQNVK
jgi:hypothetical protein